MHKAASKKRITSNNSDTLSNGHRIAALKKQKRLQQVPEISWDDDSRRDYLTGFHKRKMQRKKDAQAKAMVLMRAEKIQQRSDRKAAEEEMLQHNKRVKLAAEVDLDDDEHAADGDQQEVAEKLPREYHTFTSVTTVTTIDMDSGSFKAAPEPENVVSEHVESQFEAPARTNLTALQASKIKQMISQRNSTKTRTVSTRQKKNKSYKTKVVAKKNAAAKREAKLPGSKPKTSKK